MTERHISGYQALCDLVLGGLAFNIVGRIYTPDWPGWRFSTRKVGLAVLTNVGLSRPPPGKQAHSSGFMICLWME